jgi:hypothetical protein
MGQDHHEQIGFRDLVLNVISEYASQVGLSDDIKRQL